MVVNRIKGLCGVAAISLRLVNGWLLVQGLKRISNELSPTVSLSKLYQVAYYLLLLFAITLGSNLIKSYILIDLL